MFSIMIVKHHYETLLEYKRKEVLVKRIDGSVVSSPLAPQAKYRAPYFPGFAGPEKPRNSGILAPGRQKKCGPIGQFQVKKLPKKRRFWLDLADRFKFQNVGNSK